MVYTSVGAAGCRSNHNGAAGYDCYPVIRQSDSVFQDDEETIVRCTPKEWMIEKKGLDYNDKSRECYEKI